MSTNDTVNDRELSDCPASCQISLYLVNTSKLATYG